MRLATKFILGIVTLSLAPAAYAKEHILPDACGSDKVRYVIVDQAKPTGPPAPPAEGKAQIVFIQKFVKQGLSLFDDYSARFGVDGAWVGAAGDNSYFTVDVTPGEHHICATEQDLSGQRKDMIGVDDFTAEAGKVYYYEFNVQKVVVGGGVMFVPNAPTAAAPAPNGAGTFVPRGGGAATSSMFGQITQDQGKFRVKELKVCNFRLPVGGS